MPKKYSCTQNIAKKTQFCSLFAERGHEKMKGMFKSAMVGVFVCTALSSQLFATEPNKKGNQEETPSSSLSLSQKTSNVRDHKLDREFIRSLPTLGHLRDLDLSWNILEKGDVQKIASQLSNLQKLNLCFTNIIFADIQDLTNGRLSNLKELSLSNNTLGIGSTKCIASELTTLENLDVSNCDLNAAAVVALTSGNLRVKVLNVSGNDKIYGEGISAIANNMSTLEELESRSNHLGSADATSLANGQLSRLRVLDVAENNLCDSGVQKLGAGNLTNLRVLRVSSNNVTDKYSIPFGNLQHLETLDLDNYLSHLSIAGKEAFLKNGLSGM